MSSKAEIRDFLAQKRLALVGASRSGKGFGNLLYRELRKKGFEVFAVHPDRDQIDGEPCYGSFAALPGDVGGVVVVVHPPEALQVVRDAARAGIRRVWLQQGAESEEAVRWCEENGITAVHRECVLMFAEPVGLIHRIHRFFRRLRGRLPR